MKNVTRHLGKLEIIRQLPSSKHGNPRWLLRVDGWTCRTMPDSMLAYNVRSFEGKRVAALIGTYYGHATVDSVALDPDAIAESILAKIKAAPDIAAISLEAGHMVRRDGSRTLFQPGKVKECWRNHKGRCWHMLTEYDDGSAIRFRWSESRGSRYERAA